MFVSFRSSVFVVVGAVVIVDNMLLLLLCSDVCAFWHKEVGAV